MTLPPFPRVFCGTCSTYNFSYLLGQICIDFQNVVVKCWLNVLHFGLPEKVYIPRKPKGYCISVVFSGYIDDSKQLQPKLCICHIFVDQYKRFQHFGPHFHILTLLRRPWEIAWVYTSHKSCWCFCKQQIFWRKNLKSSTPFKHSNQQGWGQKGNRKTQRQTRTTVKSDYI